jgi:hypothetical protein
VPLNDVQCFGLMVGHNSSVIACSVFILVSLFPAPPDSTASRRRNDDTRSMC